MIMTAADIRAAAARRHYAPKILDNADLGDIAEEIVASVLEPDWRYVGEAWAGWDFQHDDGTRLQLKQGAELQTWGKTKTRAFSIPRQKGHWVNGSAGSKRPSRPGTLRSMFSPGRTSPTRIATTPTRRSGGSMSFRPQSCRARRR